MSKVLNNLLCKHFNADFLQGLLSKFQQYELVYYSDDLNVAFLVINAENSTDLSINLFDIMGLKNETHQSCSCLFQGKNVIFHEAH